MDTQSRFMQFDPPPLLRSPHMQTLLSSRLVRGFSSAGQSLLERAETIIVPCRDGVRLQALANLDFPDAPIVIVVHGWLGRADSPYVRRTADALHGAGFNVARLLLRDHGGTSALNEELFNAARIDEVADACSYLADNYGQHGAGIMGFSLGGNFSLRVAAHPDCSSNIKACFAVCPVVDPQSSADALDAGWPAYRWYFVRKWRKAFIEKQSAFPDRYDFSALERMELVNDLTEYLVERYTPFDSTREYYSHYTLTNEKLAAVRMNTRILSAADDPVIPVRTLDPLRTIANGDFDLSDMGGHCAFIEDYRLRSALDAYTVDYFQRLKGGA
jgi:predicted alpha/beta-fold hydrolase